MVSSQSETRRANHGRTSFWNAAEDWTTLVGADVEIYDAGKIVDRGRVEVTSDDGQILWLAQEGASTRRLWESGVGRYAKVAPPHA